jgi:hypothetical protein
MLTFMMTVIPNPVLTCSSSGDRQQVFLPQITLEYREATLAREIGVATLLVSHDYGRTFTTGIQPKILEGGISQFVATVSPSQVDGYSLLEGIEGSDERGTPYPLVLSLQFQHLQL